MARWVIVGAGSAGCVLANRLSADPASEVVLIEAGPPDTRRQIHVPLGFTSLMRSQVDWDYWTAPQEHLNGRSIFHPRGKTLGGSSSINAMVFQRGHPADFEHWRAAGGDGWGFDDVLPLFQRMENWEGATSTLRGRCGPLNVAPLRDPNPISRAMVAAAAQAGIPPAEDYNGPQPEGASLAQVNQRNGSRASSAVAYLRPAAKRANLRVMTEAQAVSIRFDGRRASGVVVRRGGREETIRAEREVILCGGAFNSPHLLLASGIGPQAQLRQHGIDVIHDLPGVGQNLQDHLMVLLKYRCPRPITLLNASKLGSVLRYLVFRKGGLTSNFCEFVSFVRTRAELPGADLEIAGGPAFYHILEPPTTHAFTIGAVLLQPRSTGQVTLASRDKAEKPVVQPNYLSEPEDLRVLAEGVRLARRIAACAALDDFRAEELVPGSACRSDADVEAFVRDAAETIYHPVGTCKMGKDAMAVVDPQLRVYGVEGLRVVDASIMPTVVRAHTHATVVMIAEKAAEMIRSSTG